MRYVLATTAEARIEEGLLESQFGPAYADYARRTGRFVPRLAGRLTPRQVAS